MARNGAGVWITNRAAVITNAPAATSGKVEVSLEYRGQVIAHAAENMDLVEGRTHVPFEFVIDQPQLWWPNGYGDQPLYQATAVVSEVGEISESEF